MARGKRTFGTGRPDALANFQQRWQSDQFHHLAENGDYADDEGIVPELEHAAWHDVSGAVNRELPKLEQLRRTPI